ncbi:MAG: radical SAM protein [Bacteroidales bacterium]|nr:radical SAM protein [Bacteroidales bacterium]
MYHTLYLEITRRCNNLCPYCSAGSNKKENWEKEKPVSDIVNYILKPAKKIGTRFIVFSGGEPLIYHDFINLVKEVVTHNFRFGIATNGLLLNQDLIDELLKIAGNTFVVSLGINSFDEQNKETRITDYDFFIEKLKLLNKNNIAVNVSVTVGKFNSETFCKTVEKIKELGLPYNRIPYAPRNSDNRKDMLDKNVLQKKIYCGYISCFNGFTSYTPLFLREDSYFRVTGNTEKTRVPLNPSVGCWVGSFYAINPAGDVAPCPLLSDKISAGNVYTTSLESILYESELMNKITNRNNLSGKCKKCKYVWTCGGCRSMAYYYSNDVFEEDPTCFIDELNEEELAKLEVITEKNFKDYYRMYLMSKSFN